jgi:hypothetical protein
MQAVLSGPSLRFLKSLKISQQPKEALSVFRASWSVVQ